MRRKTWGNDLNQYMVEARKRAWGPFECGHFVAGAVEAMTGQDLKTIEYSDPESLKQALKDHGSNSLYNYMRRHFGKAIAAAAAKRGDIMYRKEAGQPCLGILLSHNRAFFLGENDLVEVSRFDCERAWHVPYG